MKRKIAYGVLSFSILMSMFGTDATQAYNEGLVSQKEQKIEELNKKAEDSEKKSNMTQEDMKELILQIEILNGEREKLEKEIEENSNSIKSTREQIINTQIEILKLQSEIKERANNSKKRFNDGQNIEVDMSSILTSNSPVELVDKVYNIKETVEEDKKVIETFLEDLRSKEEKIRNLKDNQEKLSQREDESKVKKELLEKNISETKDRKDKLGLTYEEIKAQIISIQKERDILIEEINKELAIKETLTNETLEWPTDGGYISSGQGARIHPVTGEVGRFHKGIDIARRDFSYSPPIYSAEKGVVVQAQWMDGYGNMVKVKHDNGLETLYAHLSEIKVSVGQELRRGQTLGIMGTTGMSTGIHLHFEVYENGELRNPIDYYK